MQRQQGFTIIELIFVSALFAIASIFFFIQKDELRVSAIDDTKKIAINTIYFGLESVYYVANGYYPQTIDKTTLKTVDPLFFTDPAGNDINTSGSDYTYKPTDCTNGQCQGYTLRADLDNEDDFVKTNKN